MYAGVVKAPQTAHKTPGISFVGMWLSTVLRSPPPIESNNKVPMKNQSDLGTTAAPAHVLPCVFVFMFVSILFPATLFSQSSQLLYDISEKESVTYNEYSRITARNGRVYFVAHHNELWTVNPDNPEDLVWLKTFAGISDLLIVGSYLYFVAYDLSFGAELWRSNGTQEGTVLLKDIRPGYRSSGPSHLTNVRGTVYFTAADAVNGRELWKTNGTANGTVMVKNIAPRSGHSNPTSLIEMNGRLFFSATDNVHGRELWVSNGTATGTFMVKDIRPGTQVNSAPSDLVNVYGTLFFVAAHPQAGRELWKSDGTAEGTILVKDILPGSQAARIRNATAVYRTLFFSATDGVHGQELWKSDGTEAGTVMVKDLTPGPVGSTGVGTSSFQMGNFTNIYGALFFTAYQKDKHYIWRSNGTPTGTVPLVESAGPAYKQPKPTFTFFNNRIYYFNSEVQSPDVLYLMSMNSAGSDHQQITQLTIDVDLGYYPGLARTDKYLYLTGRPDLWHGFKMVKSDGTFDGTYVLEDDVSIRTDGSFPSEFTSFNQKVYFLANHSFYQQHDLWATDGTPEGTHHVFGYDERIHHVELIGNNLFASTMTSFGLVRTDLTTGEGTYLVSDYNKPFIAFMTQANGILFFADLNGAIWRSDGTVAGTRQLKKFARTVSLDGMGDKVMFRVIREDLTEELWRSDGSAAGTVMVKTISVGWRNHPLSELSAVASNAYYFVASDGVHGNELWRSDGSMSGTYMVTDLNTSDPISPEDIRHLAVFGDALYVSAMGNDGQWGLYKTDGSASGTKLLRTLPPIAHSVVVGNKLYLFTAEYQSGSEWASLWVTDGTAEGTQLVPQFGDYIGTVSHQLVDGVLYFSTTGGRYLWRSDGTPCGTFIINISSQGASPIMAVGRKLIFGSYDVQTGVEPYAFDVTNAPTSPCGETFAYTAAGPDNAEQNLSYGYPNPFRNDFALRVNGDSDEQVIVKIFTLYGKPVENLGEIDANTEYRIGQSWAPGVYIIQSARGDKITRQMIVKE